MTLIACGLNHKTAPLSIREKCVFYFDSLADPLNDLLKKSYSREAAILSTCNRTEIYCDIEAPETLMDWFAAHFDIQLHKLQSHLYVRHDDAAVSHAMRVAAGLDSLVLGEPQILGQMKQAFQLAKQIGTIGPKLEHLFPFVFSATKRIRRETSIGKNAISFASVAVELIKHIFSDISQLNALLIGSGETIELLLKHLQQHGLKNTAITSRQLINAEKLAQLYQIKAISLTDMTQYLAEVDVVISATASPVPILGKGAVERAIKTRKHRPMFMLDLAVPRDIEQEVSALEDVYLYNMDDLQKIIENNLGKRSDAISHAETIIHEETEKFLQEHQIRQIAHVIQQFRTQATLICDEEIKLAKQRLQTIETESVLEQFATRLLNKLLHHPTTQLKQWALENDQAALLIAKKLLGMK